MSGTARRGLGAWQWHPCYPTPATPPQCLTHRQVVAREWVRHYQASEEEQKEIAREAAERKQKAAERKQAKLAERKLAEEPRSPAEPGADCEWRPGDDD